MIHINNMEISQKQSSPMSWENASRQDLSAAVSDYLRNAREQGKSDWQKQMPPGQLLAQMAQAMDELLKKLWPRLGLLGQDSALIALGGYGRGELFPFSDLDVLILNQRADEEKQKTVVENLIYPLWDARLTVGHATRTIDEMINLASHDLTACTSLLDARFIAGDEGLFFSLQAAAVAEFFGPQHVATFVEKLHAERQKRHLRFGETVYLLEPNLKLCKGGLRDLNTGLWAMKARWDIPDFASIDKFAGAGAATARQQKALLEAQQFLSRLRLALHFGAGRAQDQLLFEWQEKLAPQFVSANDVPGMKKASTAIEPLVEKLMGEFYRQARIIVQETDGLLERCQEFSSDTNAKSPIEIDPDFQIIENRLHLKSAPKLWEKPSLIISAFNLALREKKNFDRFTCDALSEAVADEAGGQLVADELAIAHFRQILTDREEGRLTTILEQMHAVGALSGLIPEFAGCSGRIQHDLYHVYTVDVHSLYAVSLIKSWRRAEQAEAYPLAVAVIEELDEQELESLLLAALLHDVGKPLGHGHAVKGARLAVGVAARLGFSAEQQLAVRELVQHHILMSHVAQRRDLYDLETIASFAATVGSPLRLRQLYLLTVADTAMTAPGNLNEWKSSLLEELYRQTFLFFTHGRSGHTKQEEQRLNENRVALEIALRQQGKIREPAALAAQVPRAMLLAYATDDLLHHLQTLIDLEARPAEVLCLRTRPCRGGAWELTIACPDAPGRLAMITGVLLARRIEVLSAQVNTVDEKVLDVFLVRLPSEDAEQVWLAFFEQMQSVLRGEKAVSQLVQTVLRPSSLTPKIVPHVKTAINFAQDASEKLTVVEVQAPDRLGVLYKITQTLHQQGLNIHLSKVATEAGQVVDSFYVSDQASNGKIIDEKKLEDIRAAILEAIEGLVR